MPLFARLHARPPSRKWLQPRAIIAVAGLLTATTGVAVALPSHAGPVGAGPAPVSFTLNDGQGSWFDAGLDLFGGRSLAVAEMPRVGTDSPASAARALVNTDETNLVNAAHPPTLGAPGVDVVKQLNLDRLSEAVKTVVGAHDSRARKVDALIAQLATQLSGRSLGAAVALDKVPAGKELLSVLADVRADAKDDLVSVPVTVNFDVTAPGAAAAHTATGLIWPDGADGFPFDQSSAWTGSHTVQLTKPGLYAFACKIHPYMLGAVVVDDPLTPGVDFGKKLHVNSRALNVPSNADIIQQLVQKFFTITVPGNWERYSATEATTWDPAYPPAPILMYDGAGNPDLVPSLDAFYQTKFNEPHDLAPANKKPSVPGVGEVWVDTQMEKTAGKEKSGTATRVDVTDWSVKRKVALPQIDLNNPHNMWTDRNYKYIYQTEWFSNRLTVFERATGKYVRSIVVGPDPSHVMTRTDTDQLHVAINAGNAVVELSPGATKIDRRLLTQSGGKPAHPHAHWMSADGHTMVTPNVNTYDSTVLNIPTGKIRKEQTGELPIASGMMPDASKYYLANFLGQSVSCISLKANACNSRGTKTHNKIIDLWAGYDPITGTKGSTFGGLPIQIPVTPDGKAILVANTLTSKITVIDPKTDTVVKELPCDAGCHGINYGAKKGGGYYAYVSSKFANTMAIVDPDPNGDGDPSDAAVAGKILLDATPSTAMDDTVPDFSGMGGQGVLALPLVYNGWSQHVPRTSPWNGLTCRQRNPITFRKAC
jgi:DNA-binding beta-propeller fold protein YncE/plastocyanin